MRTLFTLALALCAGVALAYPTLEAPVGLPTQPVERVVSAESLLGIKDNPMYRPDFPAALDIPFPALALVNANSKDKVNCTVIPAADFAYALGATITRDSEVQRTFRFEDKKVTLTLDSTRADAGGKEVILTPAPFEYKGTLYLPFEPFIKALGGKVSKIMHNNYVTITLPGALEPIDIISIKISAEKQGDNGSGENPPANGDEQPTLSQILDEMEKGVATAPQLYILSNIAERKFWVHTGPDRMPSIEPELIKITSGFLGGTLPTYSRKGDRLVSSRVVNSNGGEWFDYVLYATLRSKKMPTNKSVMLFDPSLYYPKPKTAEEKIYNMNLPMAQSCSLSPDGKSLLIEATVSSITTSKASRSIYLLPVDGKKARLLANNAAQPCWSPDGKRVAFVSSDLNVMVIDVDNKSTAKTIGKGLFPVFSRDGKHLLYSQFTQDQNFISPTTFAIAHFGTKSGEFTLSELPADERTTVEQNAAFTPDDTAVIFERREAGLFRMNIDRTGETQLTTGDTDEKPAISQDGKMLYFLRDEQLHRMNLATNEIVKVTDGKPLSGFRLIPHYDAVWLQMRDGE